MTIRRGIRLCTLYKWGGSTSLGFTLDNVRASDGGARQYISDILPGSSAAFSGLHKGDRVVEVDGENVSNMDHGEVVSIITSDLDQLTLLVVDPPTDALYAARGGEIDSRIPSITRIQGPRANPAEAGQLEAKKRGTASNSEFHDIRLCTVHRWPGSKNFGYLMQFSDDWVEVKVTEVADDSSALHAGLYVGDRVVEVDGYEVCKENSDRVAEKIRSTTSTEISLLVANEMTYWYYLSRQLLMHSCSPFAISCDGPLVSLRYDEAPEQQLTSGALSFDEPEDEPPTTHSVSGTCEQATKRCQIGIRLCVIHKWSETTEFGFSLHSHKVEHERYIVDVVPGSPAAFSGLRKGDRLLEVNGVRICTEKHKQVIDRIKSAGAIVCLLVVDKQTDDYFKKHHMTLNCRMPIAVRIDGPVVRPDEDYQYDETTDVVTSPSTPRHTPMKITQEDLVCSICVKSPAATCDITCETCGEVYQTEALVTPPRILREDVDVASSASPVLKIHTEDLLEEYNEKNAVSVDSEANLSLGSNNSHVECRVVDMASTENKMKSESDGANQASESRSSWPAEEESEVELVRRQDWPEHELTDDVRYVDRDDAYLVFGSRDQDSSFDFTPEESVWQKTMEQNPELAELTKDAMHGDDVLVIPEDQAQDLIFETTHMHSPPVPTFLPIAEKDECLTEVERLRQLVEPQVEPHVHLEYVDRSLVIEMPHGLGIDQDLNTTGKLSLQASTSAILIRQENSLPPAELVSQLIVPLAELAQEVEYVDESFSVVIPEEQSKAPVVGTEAEQPALAIECLANAWKETPEQNPEVVELTLDAVYGEEDYTLAISKDQAQDLIFETTHKHSPPVTERLAIAWKETTVQIPELAKLTRHPELAELTQDAVYGDENYVLVNPEDQAKELIFETTQKHSSPVTERLAIAWKRECESDLVPAQTVLGQELPFSDDAGQMVVGVETVAVTDSSTGLVSDINYQRYASTSEPSDVVSQLQAESDTDQDLARTLLEPVIRPGKDECSGTEQAFAEAEDESYDPDLETTDINSMPTAANSETASQIEWESEQDLERPLLESDDELSVDQVLEYEEQSETAYIDVSATYLASEEAVEAKGSQQQPDSEETSWKEEWETHQDQIKPLLESDDKTSEEGELPEHLGVAGRSEVLENGWPDEEPLRPENDFVEKGGYDEATEQVTVPGESIPETAHVVDWSLLETEALSSQGAENAEQEAATFQRGEQANEPVIEKAVQSPPRQPDSAASFFQREWEAYREEVRPLLEAEEDETTEDGGAIEIGDGVSRTGGQESGWEEASEADLDRNRSFLENLTALTQATEYVENENVIVLPKEQVDEQVIDRTVYYPPPRLDSSDSFFQREWQTYQNQERSLLGRENDVIPDSGIFVDDNADEHNGQQLEEHRTGENLEEPSLTPQKDLVEENLKEDVIENDLVEEDLAKKDLVETDLVEEVVNMGTELREAEAEGEPSDLLLPDTDRDMERPLLLGSEDECASSEYEAAHSTRDGNDLYLGTSLSSETTVPAAFEWQEECSTGENLEEPRLTPQKDVVEENRVEDDFVEKNLVVKDLVKKNLVETDLIQEGINVGIDLRVAEAEREASDQWQSNTDRDMERPFGSGSEDELTKDDECVLPEDEAALSTSDGDDMFFGIFLPSETTGPATFDRQEEDRTGENLEELSLTPQSDLVEENRVEDDFVEKNLVVKGLVETDLVEEVVNVGTELTVAETEGEPSDQWQADANRDMERSLLLGSEDELSKDDECVSTENEAALSTRDGNDLFLATSPPSETAGATTFEWQEEHRTGKNLDEPSLTLQKDFVEENLVEEDFVEENLVVKDVGNEDLARKDVFETDLVEEGVNVGTELREAAPEVEPSDQGQFDSDRDMERPLLLGSEDELSKEEECVSTENEAALSTRDEDDLYRGTSLSSETTGPEAFLWQEENIVADEMEESLMSPQKNVVENGIVGKDTVGEDLGTEDHAWDDINVGTDVIVAEPEGEPSYLEEHRTGENLVEPSLTHEKDFVEENLVEENFVEKNVVVKDLGDEDLAKKDVVETDLVEEVVNVGTELGEAAPEVEPSDQGRFDTDSDMERPLLLGSEDEISKDEECVSTENEADLSTRDEDDLYGGTSLPTETTGPAAFMWQEENIVAEEMKEPLLSPQEDLVENDIVGKYIDGEDLGAENHAWDDINVGTDVRVGEPEGEPNDLKDFVEENLVEEGFVEGNLVVKDLSDEDVATKDVVETDLVEEGVNVGTELREAAAEEEPSDKGRFDTDSDMERPLLLGSEDELSKDEECVLTENEAALSTRDEDDLYRGTSLPTETTGPAAFMWQEDNIVAEEMEEPLLSPQEDLVENDIVGKDIIGEDLGAENHAWDDVNVRTDVRVGEPEGEPNDLRKCERLEDRGGSPLSAEPQAIKELEETDELARPGVSAGDLLYRTSAALSAPTSGSADTFYQEESEISQSLGGPLAIPKTKSNDNDEYAEGASEVAQHKELKIDPPVKLELREPLKDEPLLLEVKEESADEDEDFDRQYAIPEPVRQDDNVVVWKSKTYQRSLLLAPLVEFAVKLQPLAPTFSPAERILRLHRARMARLKLRFLAGIDDSGKSEVTGSGGPPSDGAENAGGSGGPPSDGAENAGSDNKDREAPAAGNEHGGAPDEGPITRLRRELRRQLGYKDNGKKECDLLGI